jgi:hypothetical protein
MKYYGITVPSLLFSYPILFLIIVVLAPRMPGEYPIGAFP